MGENWEEGGWKFDGCFKKKFIWDGKNLKLERLNRLYNEMMTLGGFEKDQDKGLERK